MRLAYPVVPRLKTQITIVFMALLFSEGLYRSSVLIKDVGSRGGGTLELSLLYFFKFQGNLISFCTECPISAFQTVVWFWFLSFTYSLISCRTDFCTILDPLSEVKTLSYVSGSSCTIKVLNILQSHV